MLELLNGKRTVLVAFIMTAIGAGANFGFWTLPEWATPENVATFLGLVFGFLRFLTDAPIFKRD